MDKREYYAEYYRKNRKRLLAKDRAYYAAHRDEVLARQKAHDIVDPEPRRARSRAHSKKRRKWFFGNLKILKQTQGCAHCGRRDGRLDYHHVDPLTKKYGISYMAARSIEEFVDEVRKCIVLCPECHGRLHAERQRQSSQIAG